MVSVTLLSGSQVLYFLDYKTYFPLQIWEENGGASYSLNVAWLMAGGGDIMIFMLLNILPHFLLQKCFSYFPPLKPRCILWSEIYGTYFLWR